MPTITETQGAMANQNPNIISNTYTGQQAPVTPTLPANVGNVPGMAQANTVAQGMATEMYGPGSTVPGLESTREAQLMELYDYDSMLGNIYGGQNIFPSVEGYVDNPADRVSALAGISGMTAGNASRTANTIDVTERAYNTAISNVLDRFLSFAQLQENTRQHNQEMELRREELRLKGGAGSGKASAMAALFGQGSGGLENMEVVPDNYTEPLTATQIKFSDAQKKIKQGVSGRPTWQSLQTAISLDPENAADYYALYEKMNQSSNPDLTAQQQTYAQSITTLGENLGTLRQAYDQVPAWQKGPIMKTVGTTLSSAGVSPNIKNYTAIASALVGPIARILSGETGPLTQTDIERAQNLIPQLSDSDADAQKKLATIDSLMKNAVGVFNTQTGSNIAINSIVGDLQPKTYPEIPSTLETQPVMAGQSPITSLAPPTEITVMEIATGDVGKIPISEYEANRSKYMKVRL